MSSSRSGHPDDRPFYMTPWDVIDRVCARDVSVTTLWLVIFVGRQRDSGPDRRGFATTDEALCGVLGLVHGRDLKPETVRRLIRDAVRDELLATDRKQGQRSSQYKLWLGRAAIATHRQLARRTPEWVNATSAPTSAPTSSPRDDGVGPSEPGGGDEVKTDSSSLPVSESTERGQGAVSMSRVRTRCVDTYINEALLLRNKSSSHETRLARSSAERSSDQNPGSFTDEEEAMNAHRDALTPDEREQWDDGLEGFRQMAERAGAKIEKPKTAGEGEQIAKSKEKQEAA